LLGVDDGEDAGDGLSQVVAVESETPRSAIDDSTIFPTIRGRCRRGHPPTLGCCFVLGGESSHLVQLGAGRDDLLDAELAQLGLELGELLRQIILALVPELDGLNLARRLITTCRVSETVSLLHCV